MLFVSFPTPDIVPTGHAYGKPRDIYMDSVGDTYRHSSRLGICREILLHQFEVNDDGCGVATGVATSEKGARGEHVTGRLNSRAEYQ